MAMIANKCRRCHRSLFKRKFDCGLEFGKLPVYEPACLKSFNHPEAKTCFSVAKLRKMCGMLRLSSSALIHRPNNMACVPLPLTSGMWNPCAPG